MRSRLAIALFFLAFPVAGLLPLSAQPPGGAADGMSDSPFGKCDWDLRQLDLDPVKLVRASYDVQANELRLVLEFQRDLTLHDTEWRNARGQTVVVDRDCRPLVLRDPTGIVAPPFLFSFEDEDGVALVSERARYGGDLIGLQGRRVRLVLPLPGKDIAARTRRVVVTRLYRE